MKRYFILKDVNTLEVICAPYENQPENSLEYFNHGFLNPKFNVYPNPTEIIEGEIVINEQPQETTLQERITQLENELNEIKSQL